MWPASARSVTDAVGGALGDAQAGRDVAHAHPRVVCDARQLPGVVGQEGPARHHQHAIKFWKTVASFWMRALGCETRTGTQPPRAASYPGLPEERMPIGLVTIMAGGRSAAAGSPGLHPPVTARRAEMIAASSGRARQQRTPALTGVG